MLVVIGKDCRQAGYRPTAGDELDLGLADPDVTRMRPRRGPPTLCSTGCTVPNRDQTCLGVYAPSRQLRARRTRVRSICGWKRRAC